MFLVSELPRPRGPSRFFFCLLAALIALVPRNSAWAALPESLATHASGIRYPLIVTQVPRAGQLRPSSGLVPRADGFDSARIILVDTNGSSRNLTAGFAAACDPDVSFDATRILFSARKDPGSVWRLYELTLPDGAVRPVTPANLEARSPIYVSTLFTIDSPEPWFNAVFVGRDLDSTERGSSLYSVRLDLPEIRRITFSPHRSFDPVQLWDGRLVYASERHPVASEWGTVRTQLFAVHTEGADVELFGGEKGGAVQTMPCPPVSGLVAFIEPSVNNRDGSGALCAVEERRPHVTYRRLSSGRDRFLHPSPFDSQSLLVARTGAARDDYGIVRFAVHTGSATPVFDTAEFHEVQARILFPRPRPDGHSSIVNPNLGHGTVYGLNCYDADPRFAPHLPPGTVHRVRFIEGILAAQAAGTGSRETPIPKRLIGEAPVEVDGSFNVEVPADTPLLLQTLDTNGMALATCGWFWVKTRESRGCIGCHEDPERIPENEYVLALRRPSNRLTLPAKDRRSISFTKDVAPILARHCAAADCHGDSHAKLKLGDPLQANDTETRSAYAFLLAPAKGRKPSEDTLVPGRYIDPGQARTSWLAWQLLGTNTSRPWDNTTRLNSKPPPPHSPPLSKLSLPPEDLRTIFQWIDLGARYEP